jgi:Ser/Thr protein kinase RdoA (MazF antagonist)
MIINASPRVISQALRLYGIAPSAKVTLITATENATYLVEDSGRRYALRINRPGYREAGLIESELEWISALSSSGAAATPTVLRTLHGDLLGEVEDEETRVNTVLMDFLPGTVPELDRAPQLIGQMGELAARIQSHGRQWDASTGFTRPHWDIETSIGRTAQSGYYGDHPDLTDNDLRTLAEADRKLRLEISRYGVPDDRYGLIHGDLRLANVIESDGELTAIDFDDCGYSWYIYDAACSLTFLEDRDDADHLAAEWIRGYRTIRPLDDDDRSVLPAFVVMRRLLVLGLIGSRVTERGQADIFAPGFTAGTVKIADSYLQGTYLNGAMAPV